jgi:hypothetical protein
LDFTQRLSQPASKPSLKKVVALAQANRPSKATAIVDARIVTVFYAVISIQKWKKK